MENRIWTELSEAVFYEYYLAEYVPNEKKKLERIEVLALIFSIVCIVGWLKFMEFYTLFAISLLLIKVMMFYRGRFFTSKEELAILEIVQKFYSDHKVELESLYQKLMDGKVNDTSAETKFKGLQKNETDMIKLTGHKKVSDKKKLNKIASKKRNNYLERFK